MTQEVELQSEAKPHFCKIHLEIPRFLFEKTFPTCLTLAHLQGALSADTVYMELLQVIGRDKQDVIQIETQEAGDKPNVVVATFETSALELLFPFPQLRGPYCPGVDVDLLMEPTRDFPGIIAPKVNLTFSKVFPTPLFDPD